MTEITEEQLNNDLRNDVSASPEYSLHGKNAEEILSFLVQNGTITMDGVETQMRLSRRKKILDAHPYAFFQGADGRWRTYVKDEEKTNGRRLIVRKSLEDLQNQICEHYQAGSSIKIKEEETMESLYNDWIEYKKLHVSSSTIDRTMRDWERYYANEDIIRRPIIALTKLEIDTWAHEMIRKHEMNKHRWANFRAIINQELDYAVDLEIISSNPFKKVKVDTKRVLVPEHKKPDRTQVYLKDEIPKLQELAWEDFHKKDHPVHQLTPLAVMFMFVTGLRIGEACGLRYEDIDGKQIIVRRFVRSNGEIVDGTKGNHGDRFVPLVPEALKLIETARQRQREEGTPDDGYIFSMRETPVLYSSVAKAFYSYCKKMGIDSKSSHKARKTFISSLIDGNININTVRQIAGHVDERTTLNNYCFDRSSDEEKYEKMAKALIS